MTERIQLPALSPGGAEYTRMAAQIAKLTPATRCLTLGLSLEPAAITLARFVGCHVTAISRSPERTQAALAQAEQAGVSHLIDFDVRDVTRIMFPNASFDFVAAEGGALTNIFTSPDMGLARVIPFLKPGGTLAVSDLIYALSPPPDAVRDRFPLLWTERRYLAALEAHTMDIQFACWVARRGWRAFIAGSGEQRDFWESRDAREGLAYLYVVARR